MFNLTLFAWMLLLPIATIQFFNTMAWFHENGLDKFVYPYWWIGWFVVAACIAIIGA